jgi:hypothetical protein
MFQFSDKKLDHFREATYYLYTYINPLKTKRICFI